MIEQIKTDVKALAEQLDAIPVLEVLALRGNPVMRAEKKHDKADRAALMALMQRLRKIDCSLRVLDTEITGMFKIFV